LINRVISDAKIYFPLNGGSKSIDCEYYKNGVDVEGI
jgi:hypothetical protein